MINRKKIVMIGCGKLGMPCAEVMSQIYDVVGYDISIHESRNVKMMTNIQDAVMDRDIVFIALPTPHFDKQYFGNVPAANLEPVDFDYSIVKNVLVEINRYINKNQLVVLISTVLTGTIREQLSKCLTNSTLIYNPYLIALGTVGFDMIHPDMLIIGTETGEYSDDVNELISFYEPLMKNSCYKMIGTWEEAETTKIFYNSFISMKVNMVNMIQDISEKNGNINVDVVTEALSNCTGKIVSSKYMIAGLGTSGPCFPRDNIVLSYLAKKLDLGYDLSQANVREQQAKNIAKKLTQLSDEYKMTIVIHGRSYKTDLPHTEGSYSELIGYFIKEYNKEFYYVDPLTNDVYNSDVPCIYFMAHNPFFSFDKSKNNFDDKQLYCKIADGSIILDPWRSFPHISKYKIFYYGSYI